MEVEGITELTESEYYVTDSLPARVNSPDDQYTNGEVLYVDGISPYRTVDKSINYSMLYVQFFSLLLQVTVLCTGHRLYSHMRL
jgi:hypothetical protein